MRRAGVRASCPLISWLSRAVAQEGGLSSSRSSAVIYFSVKEWHWFKPTVEKDFPRILQENLILQKGTWEKFANGLFSGFCQCLALTGQGIFYAQDPQFFS